jgi:hypothetical protein
MAVAMTDGAERQIAAEIEQSHPQWMVLWGYHSRLFWAFPLFQVPRGTIVSAHDRDGLLANMHTVELRASARQPMTVLSPVAAVALRG